MAEMTAAITLSFTAWMALGFLNCAIAYWIGYRDGRKRRHLDEL